MRRTRNQEIRSCLTIGGLISELDEVVSSLIGGTKVRHLAFVDNAHFVEELVQALTSLIDRHNGGHTHGIRSDTEGLDKLEGRRRTKIKRISFVVLLAARENVLKTSSSSIPSTEQTPRSHDLCQTDPLLLTTTDTPHPSVSNLRVLLCPQSEHAHQYVNS